MAENVISVLTFIQIALFGASLSFIYILWSSMMKPFTFACQKKHGKYTKRIKAIEFCRCFFLILCDLMYFLIITPICAIFLHSVNFGMIRWYIIATALLGFCLYKASIGRLQQKILEIFFRIIIIVSKKMKNLMSRLTIGIVKSKMKTKKLTEKRKIIYEINNKQG